MKKYLFIFMAAATMLAAAISCSKGIENDAPDTVAPEASEEELVIISISAELPAMEEDEAAQGAASRASLSGSKVYWAAGDKLAVWDGVALREFSLEKGAGTVSGTFSGPVDPGATTLNALFPHSAGTWNGSSWDIAIPSEQNVGEQSIDPSALIATATGTVSGGLTFSNIPALMRFTVEDGVTGIIFHSRAKEALAGTSPAVFVTLPGTAGTYEVAVNPGTYDGIRAFITNDSGTFLKEGTSSLALSANQGKPLGTIAPTNEVVAITTPEELVNYLKGTPTLDGYICKDLDMSAASVTTCASYSNAFDGQYHKLTNWDSDGVALFNSVTTTGSVNRITLDSSCSLENHSNANDFGFIVQTLQGTMTGCVNMANVVASWTGSDMTNQHVFGPIVGRNNHENACMTNCVNQGNVDISFTTPSGSNMSTQYFGGVVGMVGTQSANVRMSGCRNEGGHITVTMTNGAPEQTRLRNTYLGGIAGATGLTAGDADHQTGYSKQYGIITGCVNDADVSLTWDGGTGGYLKVGGVIGVSQAQLLECVNNGDVSLANSTTKYTANCTVGGIAAIVGGPADPTARNCTNNGKVTFRGSYTNAGSAAAYGSGSLGYYWTAAGGCFGIVGDNSTLIDNCDCNAPVDFDITMSEGGGSGHCLGGIAGICKCPISNCDHNYTASNSVLNSQAKNAWLGGIAGLAYNNITNCTTNAPIVSNRQILAWDTGSEGKDKKAAYLGGIVGRLMSAATISGCTNSGPITLTTASDHGNVNFAGIVGYTAKVTINNCTNSNTLSFDGGGETAGQLYMGGIAGYYTAKSVMNGCTSTGDMTATNWANTAFSYIGGIASQYSGSGNTITDCTHNADITVTSAAKLRVAGIGAAINGTFTGNVHSGDITVTGAAGGEAAANSQVGGLAGYWGNGNIADSATRSCSVSGAITTKLAANSMTGGVIGGCNVNSTWTNLSVNTQVTTTGSEYGGALLGGFHADNSSVITIAGSPVYTGTTVNGSPISSSNICGFYNTSGSFSGYSD